MKSEIIELLYDYNRRSKTDNAKISWTDKDICNLFIHKESLILSNEEVIKKLKSELKILPQYNKKGRGYIGKSMSVNAKRAYKKGLKPISKFNSEELQQNGFLYSYSFFKWLVDEHYIVPKESHHTSASKRMTNFYNKDTISFVVKFYNLDLLYNIYCGKIGKAEAKRKRNIQYAVVEILDTLIGGNKGKRIKINCILCDNILFYSHKLCFHKEDDRINILEQFDERPFNNFNNKYLKGVSEKLLVKRTEYFYKYIKK